MKKYFVIGNPIDHSLSPKLHNYWIKKKKIDAVYDKIKLEENELENIISKVREEKITGINVTVPYKKKIIPFLDKLSPEAEKSQSVNTIYKEENVIIGHNTDIAGFELAIRHSKYDLKGKNIFILGAGGVVSSLIVAIKKLDASKIIVSNRTKKKADNLKFFFKDIDIVSWREIPDFDMIINATSIGLKNEDGIKFNYSAVKSNKFFYDLIYNPKETIFLKKAKQFGNRTENGKMMFIYQAHQAFTLWHKVMPIIDDETINLLN